MKIKILILAIVLILVQIMVLPALASADTTGNTLITGNLAATVSSVSPNTGVQGNTGLPVTITGTDFTGASAVSFGAGITVTGYTVDSATQISATISIASGATPGVRDVTVTVAGLPATKSSAFTVQAVTISITAPSGFSLPSLIKGQTATGNSVTAGTVTTNAASWTVTAKDANTGGTAGRMVKTGGSLTNQLQIGKTGTGPWVNAGDTTGLVYTQADGTALSLYAQQVVDAADTVGSYSITIAFVASTP